MRIPVPVRFFALCTALCIASMAQGRKPSTVPSLRMPDSRQWTARNLAITGVPSFCYDDSAANCDKYGRLYTWESARRACPLLGAGWRLPSSDEWRQLARHYGGIHDDSKDRGKAAYLALLTGGSSGFNALLGGGRDLEGKYGRLEAHGFYWTATEGAAGIAEFYNFGKGAPGFYRQPDGEKPRAFSVRCIRD